jgi:hypothetical protein
LIWQFVYLDDPEDPDAEGYHDLTIHGRPLSKVFVKPTLENGDKVSVTASHELFEMVIDPIANMWAESATGTDLQGRRPRHVEFRLSDLVEPFKHPRGTKYDHLGLLKAPFTMTKGGYVIVKRRGKVKEHFASKAKARRFARENRYDHRSEFRKPDGLHTRPKTPRGAAKRKRRR